MERRLVHRHRDVIAAPRNVQKVAGPKNLVEHRAGRRHRMASQVVSVHAVHRAPVEQPSLGSVELKDEYFLVVAMQVETVQGAPSGVDIDLRAAAEERLE